MPNTKESLPVANLTIVDLALSWTPIPLTHNCSQLILDEGQIHWCFPKVSGDFYLSKSNGRSFRIQHVGITGSVPLEMTSRFKTQLSKAILKRVERYLGTYVPGFNLDLLEVLEGSIQVRG